MFLQFDGPQKLYWQKSKNNQSAVWLSSPGVDQHFLALEVILLSDWLRGWEAANQRPKRMGSAPVTAGGVSGTRQWLEQFGPVIPSCWKGIPVIKYDLSTHTFVTSFIPRPSTVDTNEPLKKEFWWSSSILMMYWCLLIIGKYIR